MRVVCVCACHRSSTVGWLKASQLPRVQRSPCRSSARVSAQSEFIINGQKHEYPVTNDHAKIVDGRTYLKLCRRPAVVRRMLAAQVDADCSRNDSMWVLARSDVIDMIAELRFRKMKDHMLDSAQGKREFWNQSETPLCESHNLRPRRAADVRYKFWQNPTFQRAIATLPETLEIECPIDGVDAVSLTVLSNRKGPAWIQMSSSSMAWLTAAVAAQFAAGSVVQKNQPRKAMKLSEATESTTASGCEPTEAVAAESDDGTDSNNGTPEPEMTEPGHDTDRKGSPSMSPEVVRDATGGCAPTAVNPSIVQTQLSRFFAPSSS